MKPSDIMQCQLCGIDLTDGNSYLDNRLKNPRMSVCQECQKGKSKKYYREHKERRLAQAKKYSFRIKREVLCHYGGKCACCGENKLEFLAIDHINGGGNIHRRSIGISGKGFYFWLRKNNYPDGYRVLCHNCNQSIGWFGYCPHTMEAK